MHDSFIGYNAISFIGETGGTLGMCVGWSALFFMELLLSFIIKDIVTKDNLRRISLVFLMIIFTYWCSFSIKDYNDEVESMELNLVPEMYPPHLTICRIENGPNGPKDAFMEWFHQMYPCSGNHPDYKNSLTACLQSNNDEVIAAVNQYSGDDFKLPTPVLISKQNWTMLPKSLWQRVFHDIFGVCWTLNSKYWIR